MFNVKTVEETFEIIKEKFICMSFEYEEVSILDSINRVLHENVYSEENIPSFNKSTVDGYAVKAKDTFGASESMPAQLKLVPEVKMGITPEFVLNEMESCYIPTGGELPKGADSVVMIEYSEDYRDGFIYLNKSVAPGNGVIYCGDDVKNGDLVIVEGTVIKEKHVAVLASLGYEYIKVRKKPVVGIISTGDELISIGEKPVGSQVRDINSYALSVLVKSCGGDFKSYGIVKDIFAELQAVVDKAILECDIVIISGGSSVGVKDQTLKVIEDIKESEILVHGIAVKPGKPTILAKATGKPVVGLPGHPGSAFFIFKVFMERLIKQMLGQKDRDSNRNSIEVECLISQNYPSNHGREEYVAVKIQENIATPLHGKSGLIRLLADSSGFIRIGKNSEGLLKGEKVKVQIW